MSWRRNISKRCSFWSKAYKGRERERRESTTSVSAWESEELRGKGKDASSVRPIPIMRGLSPAGRRKAARKLGGTGGTLGHLFVAFVVAYVNAALISAVATAPGRVLKPTRRMGSPNRETFLVSLTL